METSTASTNSSCGFGARWWHKSGTKMRHGTEYRGIQGQTGRFWNNNGVSSVSPRFPPILMPLKPTSSSHRVPVEEVSEALHQRMGSDLRSPRDLEGHSSSMERAHLRQLPPYARRSPGRTAPCHQSQAVRAAALPLLKK